MEFTFWQVIAAEIIPSTAVAFVFAWFTRNRSSAYKRGLLGSLLAVVLVPGCVPMYLSDVVAANQATEMFGWLLIPSLGASLICAVYAIDFARTIRWHE